MKKWWVIFAILLVTSTSQANKPVIFEWDRATTNTDGSCITDYGGYVLYVGQESQRYDMEFDIGVVSCADTGVRSNDSCDNIYRCSYIRSVFEGTWFFAVKSYTSKGVRSDFSNEDSITIGEGCGFLCNCRRKV